MAKTLPNLDPWPVRPRRRHRSCTAFGLTAFLCLWEPCTVVGQCLGCPASRASPAGAGRKEIPITYPAQRTDKMDR